MTPDQVAAPNSAARRESAPRLAPLLAGTAVLAVALGAGMAHGATFIGNGVAFQGYAYTALGNVSLASGNSAGGPTDTLTVHTPTAIIDWQPYDGASNGQPVHFLASGSTGIFENGPETSGFTVLNRINPGEVAKPIEFDGHVVSQLVDAAGTVTRGGNVWFYAPGGIIIGATGAFDVGSLILTPNTIDTANDTALPDPTTGIHFAATAGSTTSVMLKPGAQITETAPGSYLAIVAPRIDQAGTVNVNGSVGYVAAQAADITINAGLFNIANATGSQVAPGGETTLSHTGTTTGDAQTGSAAPHAIYMVAVPANDAVTMLVGGTVGYRAATTATEANGAIVLGAGATVTGDPATFGDTSAYALLGGPAIGIVSVTAGRFTSPVAAVSSGNIYVATTGGDVAFTDFLGKANGVASLHATNGQTISSTGLLDLENEPRGGAAVTQFDVDAGARLTVGGLLQGFSDAGTLIFNAGGAVTADTINLTASSLAQTGPVVAGTSTLSVTGSVTTNSLRVAASVFPAGVDGTAGTARLAIAGGTVRTGDLTVSAAVQGTGSEATGALQGGNATVTADGGSLTATGATLVDVSARSPAAASTTGGTAFFQAVNGGTIAAAATTVTAASDGGSAAGGVVTLQATDGGSLSASGAVQLSAFGSNGAGAGAAAGGGAIGITASGGTVSLAGTTLLDARGLATDVTDATAPGGYDAAGGSLAIVTRNDASGRSGDATFGGAVTLDASALAYQGRDVATGSAMGGFAGLNAQAGGGTIAMQAGLLIDASANANSVGSDAGIVSSGGQSSIEASGGTVTLAGLPATGGLEIAADAQGGTATGGVAALNVSQGGSITATSLLSVHAKGSGGTIADGSIPGFAGTGGTTAVTAGNGTITLASVVLDPTGSGGGSVGFEGGAGTGGTASIATTDPAARITIGDYADLQPFGYAGTGLTGTANGRGGTSSITATGGTIDFTGGANNGGYLGYSLYATAGGTGSTALTEGRDPVTSGIGYGGTVTMTADAGGTIAIADDVYLSSFGYGGFSSVSGAGGNAVGGSVTLAALNGTGQPGTIGFGSMFIDNGAFGAQNGGAATAGTSAVLVGRGASISGTTLTAQTYAYGGISDSGTADGGAATGGTTSVTVDGGTLSITGDASGAGLSVSAFAVGGASIESGSGAAATGSTATVAVNSGTLSAPTLGVNAADIGGGGGDGVNTIGGNGGAATGGSATLTVAGGAPTQGLSAGVLSVTSLTIGTSVVGGAGGRGTGFFDDPNNPTPVQNGFAGGAGGAASGGAATLAMSGGTLTATDLTIAASTTGGNGGLGGDGAGLSTAGPALGGVGGAGGAATLNSATLSGFGGSVTAGTTAVTATDNGGAGGTGGLGGTDATGARTRAASGAFGDARGGGATIATDFGGSAALGATSLTAGGTIGGTIEAGVITLAAHDSDGTAPAAPLTLDSLTATMNANFTTTGDLIEVNAAAPITIANDAGLSGFALTRFDMAGRGTLAVGGRLAVDALEVIGTQTDPAAGTIAITAGSAAIDARFAGVTLAPLTTTAGDLELTSANAISATDLVSAGNATLTAAGSIGFGTLTAATDIDITAGGALSAATLTSVQGAIDATAAGSSAITTVVAGGEITIDSGGSARYGTVTGGTDPSSGENDGGSDFGSVALVAEGGDLTIDGGVSAYQSIGLVAAGALSAPSLVAANGGSIGVIADGAITLGTVTAPDLFYVGGLGAVANLDPDASAAEIVATLRAEGPVATGGAITIDDAQAGSATIDAGTTLAITDTLRTTGAITALSGGTMSLAALQAGGDITLNAGDALTATTLSSGGSIAATTVTALSVGSATGAADVNLHGETSVTADTIVAGRDAEAVTYFGDNGPRSIRVGSVTAGDDVTLAAFGTLDAGTIITTGLGQDGTNAGSNYGNIAGSGVLLLSGEGASIGRLQTVGSVAATNFVQTLGNVVFDGTGGIRIDDLTAGGAVAVSSVNDFVTLGNVSAGPITASGTRVSITAPGSLTLASVNATTGDATVTAGGDLTATGAITSTIGDLVLSAGGSVDVAALSAGDSATVDAGTTLHAGSITVGTNTASTANDGTGVFGSLALIAGDAITVDTPLSVTGSIGLVSRTAGIDLDSLAAGANGSVAVLAGGDIRLGTVSAPDLLYVGGPAALAALGADPSVSEILATLRTAGPIASGGAVTIGQASTGSATIAAGTTLTLAGPLTASAGAVTLAAGGDLATQDVTTPGMLSAASSGGGVTVGTVRAGSAMLSAATTLNAGGPLIASAGAVTLAAAGDLVAQDVSATGSVAVTSSGGAVTIGTVGAGVPTTAGAIRLTAMQALTAGTLAASGSIAATSTAAGLLLQDVTSTGGGVTARAGGGDIALGAVRAAGSITIVGTGRITAGDLTAGTGPLLPGESGGSGGTDPATGGIAAGFDGTAITRCDDCYTDAITLPFAVNYFGRSYATTYVSNNGYLTFNQGQGNFTPGGLGTGYFGLPIIAAFFADVDTRNGLSGPVTYGSGTFAGRQAFGATWNRVGYYAGAADKLNDFQIILTNRGDTGAGNFDIYYNYTNIGWETGGASGGVNGFGGTSAAVGYNAGTGNQSGTFFELPGSRVPGSFINGGTAPLITTTNDGIAGQLLFTVRNGQVSIAAPAEPPSIHVSNLGGGGTSDIRLGNLSAEGAEVHGTGRVTVGNVDVGDRGSGITVPGQAFATVLDAGLGLAAGDVAGTGLIALGSRGGDVSAGTIAGSASVMVLADGSVTLRQVTTGTGAGDTLYIGGAATDALSGFGFTTLLSGTGFDPATLATVTPAAAGGAITIAGPITTGTLRVSATGIVTLADATATGAMLIDGAAGLATGALDAGGTIDLASAAGGIATGAIAGVGAVTASGRNGLALGSVTSSSGAISLASAAGGIVAGALGAADDVTATGSGDVVLGAVNAADVSAESTGSALTIGATTASGSVALRAGSTLTLGSIDATSIALTSADIAIASGATIGSARTMTIGFVNSGTGRTVIGDHVANAAGDYALSAAELASAHANAISVGPQAAEGTVAATLIGDLTLHGSARPGGNLLGSDAAFTVTSQGAIDIVGAAVFTGLSNDETVTLRSTAGDITGVLPAGSIMLDDGNGGLAGTLALDAGTILFATSDAAGAVGAATTAAAIDAALGNPGTLANPAGYLRAGTVSLRFSKALYTQNSGASTAVTDRAGVTAGDGGILLLPTTASAASPANLVLNARLVRNGATLTGNQVLEALALQPTGFATGATLNSCLLDTSNCGVTTIKPDPNVVTTALVQSIQPVQDVVSQVQLVSGLGNGSAYSFTTPTLIASVDLTTPTLAPEIDEPVTGAGNDALWVNIGIGRELAPMGGKPTDAPKP